MYIGECWGYGPMDVQVRECEGLATLRLYSGNDVIAVTMSAEQLRLIELAVGEYLDEQAREEKTTAATVAG